LAALHSIILEVTQACNHACVHCYNYWAEDRAPVSGPGALSRGEILNLVREIRSDVPLKSVAVSGGEPFLRADLGGIVSDLVNDGLEVTVITNSTFLNEARLQSFPREVLFEVTLFSADAATHDHIAGRSGAFQDVINGALAVHRRQSGLAVACVVGRPNLPDLGRTIELAVAIGANGVAINRVNLTRQTFPMGNRLTPTVAEVRTMLETAEAAAARFGMTVAVSVPIPPCVVDPRPYGHLAFGWCPRGGPDAYYTIGYNGLVRPCNHSSAILGDLRRQAFAEIVKSDAAAAFWAPIPPECLKCDHPLRDSCRGGCPAASDECYGTRLRMDPFVELAGPGVPIGVE
jgi:radical SAM protein with 4Fe4S-binding SPASM domain